MLLGIIEARAIFLVESSAYMNFRPFFLLLLSAYSHK